MSLPKAMGAYLDCESHFNNALGSEHGIALDFEEPGMATQFRLRMNTYREKLRKQSKKLYEPTDEKYSTSVYDSLSLSIDAKNPTRVIIRPYRTPVKAVTVLGPED